MQAVPSDSPTLFHLKWVAKIALLVAGAASSALLLAVFLATDDKGTTYASIISSHSLTQLNLGPVLWGFGLLAVAVAALSTWAIALHSSFRIAGPLFRFAQNMRALIDDPLAVPMAIRRTDMLQQEWRSFDASQARLREHYGELRHALQACRQAMASGAAPHDAAAQAVDRLLEVERRVQL